MNKYIKPELTLREAVAKEKIGNIIIDLTSIADDYFDGDEEQED